MLYSIADSAIVINVELMFARTDQLDRGPHSGRLHGKVVGDLSSRSGRILGTDSEGQFQIVREAVPAMELYATQVSCARSQADAAWRSEAFSRDEKMPREIEHA